MTHSIAMKLGVCSLAAVLTVTMSAAGFAADRSAPPPSSSKLLTSAHARVQQLAKVPTRTPGRVARQEGSGYDAPGTFFKTKRGVALLVLAAAGVGYMTYSAFHDRIHSETREQLTN